MGTHGISLCISSLINKSDQPLGSFLLLHVVALCILLASAITTSSTREDRPQLLVLAGMPALWGNSERGREARTAHWLGSPSPRVAPECQALGADSADVETVSPAEGSAALSEPLRQLSVAFACSLVVSGSGPCPGT